MPCDLPDHFKGFKKGEHLRQIKVLIKLLISSLLQLNSERNLKEFNLRNASHKLPFNRAIFQKMIKREQNLTLLIT
jgi:hypothetical protein